MDNTPYTLFSWKHPLIQLQQQKYGDSPYKPVPDTGCINRPKIMLVFMNPTARNITTHPGWNYNSYPWIGTKQVWKFLFNSSLITYNTYNLIQDTPSTNYTIKHILKIYKDIANHKVYIAEFLKATKKDSTQPPTKAFKHPLDFLKQEIKMLKPQYIIALGTTVAHYLLEHPIQLKHAYNKIFIKNNFLQGSKVLVTYYPVGQGARNVNKTISTLKMIK